MNHCLRHATYNNDPPTTWPLIGLLPIVVHQNTASTGLTATGLSNVIGIYNILTTNDIQLPLIILLVLVFIAHKNNANQLKTSVVDIYTVYGLNMGFSLKYPNLIYRGGGHYMHQVCIYLSFRCIYKSRNFDRNIIQRYWQTIRFCYVKAKKPKRY